MSTIIKTENNELENSSSKKILVAAVELFASQGMGVTTVAQIVDRSGVTADSFDQLFGTKENVFDKLIEEFGTSASEGTSSAQFDKSNLKASLVMQAEMLTALHRRFRMLFKTMAQHVSVDPTFMEAMRKLRDDGENAAVAGFGHLIEPENEESAREKLKPVMQMMLAILTHGVVFESGPIHYLSPDCSEQLATMALSILMSAESETDTHNKKAQARSQVRMSEFD